jgi:crotonobetainyl-CoA:carnitine CoA-transferase CaiB-like acyl-CoA transferase
LQAKAGQFSREELLSKLHQMGVPAGAVRNMPEVFAESAAQELLLHWALPDGTEVKSVRSVVFELE